MIEDSNDPAKFPAGWQLLLKAIARPVSGEIIIGKTLQGSVLQVAYKRKGRGGGQEEHWVGNMRSRCAEQLVLWMQ